MRTEEPERSSRPFTPGLVLTVAASVVGALVAGSAFVFDWAPRIGDALVTGSQPTWIFLALIAASVSLATWLLQSWRSHQAQQQLLKETEKLHDQFREETEKRDDKFREETKKLRDEIAELAFQRAGLDTRLSALEEELITDPVTGVPNQTKLARDFERLRSSRHTWHAILIDLDDFGSINEQFNLLGGDKVIRHVARGMFESIRRSEFMYRLDKRPDAGRDTEIEAEEREHMYRLYSGGDEFIVLVQGSIINSIGLLNRLCRLVRDLSDGASDLVGPPGVQLSFTAGIAPLIGRDTVNSLRMDLETCYKTARNGRDDDVDGKKAFWVYWDPSWLTEADKKLPHAEKILSEMVELFGRPDLEAGVRDQ